MGFFDTLSITSDIVIGKRSLACDMGRYSSVLLYTDASTVVFSLTF